MASIPSIVYQRILSHVIVSEKDLGWSVDEQIRLAFVCWKWHELVSTFMARSYTIRGRTKAQECLHIINDPTRSKYCLVKSINRLNIKHHPRDPALSSEEIKQINESMQYLTFKDGRGISNSILSQPAPNLLVAKLKNRMTGANLNEEVEAINQLPSTLERIHSETALYSDTILVRIVKNEFPNLTYFSTDQLVSDINLTLVKALNNGSLKLLKHLSLKKINHQDVTVIIESLKKGIDQLEEFGIGFMQMFGVTINPSVYQEVDEYIDSTKSIKSVKLDNISTDQLSRLSLMKHIKELKVNVIQLNPSEQAPEPIPLNLDKFSFVQTPSIKQLSDEWIISSDSNIRSLCFDRKYVRCDHTILKQFLTRNKSLESISVMYTDGIESIINQSQSLRVAKLWVQYQYTPNTILEQLVQCPNLELVIFAGRGEPNVKDDLYNISNNTYKLISISRKSKIWKRI